MPPVPPFFHAHNLPSPTAPYPSLSPTVLEPHRCSGFIVVDGQGRVAAPKTAAFLQVGPEQAFADLERTLRRTLAAAAPSAAPSGPPKGSSSSAVHAAAEGSGAEYPFGVGRVAQLDGLASDPALNGRSVNVLGFDPATGRFRVQLLEGSGGGRVLAVRPCSLAPAEDSESTDSSSLSANGSIATAEDNRDQDEAAAAAAAEAAAALSNLRSIEPPPSVGCSARARCGLRVVAA